MEHRQRRLPPFSLLQPPLVVGDTWLLGWAGQATGPTGVAPPGNFAWPIDARTGELTVRRRALIPEELIPRTGTANIWTAR